MGSVLCVLLIACLNDPTTRRMLGDIDVQDASTTGKHLLVACSEPEKLVQLVHLRAARNL
jgi:hypothetical protein